MRSWKIIAALAIFAFAAPLIIHAENSANPTPGTWKLNLAKSKYDPPGAAPVGQTRTVTAAPDGTRIAGTTELTGGKLRQFAITYRFDGKPHALSGNPDFNAIKFQRRGPRAYDVVLLRSGRVIGHGTNTVSDDGQTWTEDETYTSAAGQAIHRVMVFDRR